MLLAQCRFLCSGSRIICRHIPGLNPFGNFVFAVKVALRHLDVPVPGNVLGCLDAVF